MQLRRARTFNPIVTVEDSIRRRIRTPSGEVQVIRRSDGTTETLYLTTDHLGSTEAVLNAAGTVLARTSFAAWGARRGSNWQGVPSQPEWQAIADTTRRGYTGHEHLDNVLLVHMNGRVYDPAIGRFISADPFVDGVEGSQGWNRYGYVHNQPLSNTDPTGYQFVRGSSLNWRVAWINRDRDVEQGNAASDGAAANDAGQELEQIVVNGTRLDWNLQSRMTPLDWNAMLRGLSASFGAGGGAGGGGAGGRGTAKEPGQEEPQGEQPEPPCSEFWGAVRDATGGESNQAWHNDVADNFVDTTDNGASGLLSTGLSVAGASTTARSWGGITFMQLGQQAWNSRYGAIQTPGLIGARSVPSAYVTAGASWVVNAVLIKGAYNSGVLAGSLIRTGVNRAADGMCTPQ